MNTTAVLNLVDLSLDAEILKEKLTFLLLSIHKGRFVQVFLKEKFFN